MKTQDSIRLILAATLVLGLLSSLLLLLSLASIHTVPGAHITPLQAILVPLPFFLSCLASVFQFKYVMKPWNKALGELVSTALNIQETTAPVSPSGADQLSILRTSIETAAVQVKETRLREMNLIQHAVDVICVIDLQCKILSVNPAAKSVWGYNTEELVGQQITDFLVSESDVKNTRKMLFGADKSIDRIYFENKFRKKSGEVVDLLWSAHLSARDRGLFCIAHDITDRKRAEQMLRESEERVRGILESLPAGVALVNQQGIVEFMNKTAMELTGYSADELKDLAAFKLFSFIKASEPLKIDLESSAPTAGFDCQIMRITGERFPAEASTRNLVWGKSNACLVIFLDATLKYELERAKREFVAMVSHDLRTPLTTISLIFSYMLDGLGGDLSSDGTDFAQRGKQACDRLMTLVQDLLDLEKMRAGKFTMDMQETQIAELIDAAVSAVGPYAASQGIKIASENTDVEAYCDGGRIIQVLINLLSNGIKFSAHDGEVKIAVSSDDKFVTVCVSNMGKSIAQDKLSAIFEKFEQADARGTVERKGTGLGLTISKTIIEQHGGKIWAESSDSEGTRFLFTIPKAPPPEIEA